jgi:hypothetical protein
MIVQTSLSLDPGRLDYGEHSRHHSVGRSSWGGDWTSSKVPLTSPARLT